MEQISELCCLEEEGPMFDYELFVEGLCETWVIIPEEYVYDIRPLACWKLGIKIASILEGEIKQIAEGIKNLTRDRDKLLEDPKIAKRFDKDVIEDFDLNIQAVLDSIEGPEQLVERAVEQDIVLTEEEWQNFEFVDDESRKELLLCCIGVFREKREILTALMENKELFDKYIYSIL